MLSNTRPTTQKDVTGVINVLTKADPHLKHELYQDFEFIDDVSGRVLDHEFAVKARKLEMDFFRKMRVYDKVPRAVATRDGCRVISTKWVDINKGDQKAPNYRARLVGRELKLDSRLDLFAATPPLEAHPNYLLFVRKQSVWPTTASNHDGGRPAGLLLCTITEACIY